MKRNSAADARRLRESVESMRAGLAAIRSLAESIHAIGTVTGTTEGVALAALGASIASRIAPLIATAGAATGEPVEILA